MLQWEKILSFKSRSPSTREAKKKMVAVFFQNFTNYRISSVIRWSFPFQNNPKTLDPSYKTDLDLWHCLGRVKLIIAKFHMTDLVNCRHSSEGKLSLMAE